jgi:uroporphyrinogen decarboxylase
VTHLLLRALRREDVPRRPIWLMRQAGRYLPEYRALRAEHAFLELARDPALAAEVTLQPLARFPLDAAIVFADLMSPVAAMGVDFDFAPGPVLERPVRTRADVDALRVPAADEIAPEVPATLRIVRERLERDGRDAALVGFGGAPWSIAAYLVQGQGAKDFPALRMLLAEDPVLLGRLLEKVTELVAAYLVAQHRAGAHVVQVFDSWAGLLSEPDYRAHVAPHHAALCRHLRDAGVPTVYFAQGAPHLVAAHAELPTDGLALCWRSDLAEVQRRFGREKAVQGNLDPAALLAGPETTARAARALLERVERRGHVVNLGHGLVPETPLESVAALVETVRGEG